MRQDGGVAGVFVCGLFVCCVIVHTHTHTEVGYKEVEVQQCVREVVNSVNKQVSVFSCLSRL